MLLGMAVRMGLDLNLYRKNEHGKVYSDEDRTRAYEVGDVFFMLDRAHRSIDPKQRENVDPRSCTRPVQKRAGGSTLLRFELG